MHASPATEMVIFAAFILFSSSDFQPLRLLLFPATEMVFFSSPILEHDTIYFWAIAGATLNTYGQNIPFPNPQPVV